jgi:hypothetical protein
MLNHTGATTIEATTTTSTRQTLSVGENHTINTVHRALNTRNPDSLIAAAVLLRDFMLSLLHKYDHAYHFEVMLKDFQHKLMMIYHSMGSDPHQRGFNLYHYSPDSETPEDEPQHQLALQVLKKALMVYNQAKEAATPREPESPTTPREPESPTSVYGM